MAAKKLTFSNRDGQPLSALLNLPANGAPRHYALFAHCFTCGKDVKAAYTVAKTLAGSGIAVLRFDFTGLGESAGDFADTTFSSNVADLIAAAAFMTARYGGPELLIGHSLGGTAVIRAAADIPSSRAVVTIGSPAEPVHVTRHLSHIMDRIRDSGQARVEIAGKALTIKKAFVEDVAATRVRDVLASLDRALLVMHAPDDDVVAVDNAVRLFSGARHPKSFISLDTADHLLSDRRDAAYAGRVIAAWASRYLEITSP
jgi:alpha/beta superfamily hydrolase